MTDQFTAADSAAQLILSRTSLRPKIGLVLGSGLGAFADSLTDAARVPYAEIPSSPQPPPLVTPDAWSLATPDRWPSPPCRAACISMKVIPRRKLRFPFASSPAWAFAR